MARLLGRVRLSHLTDESTSEEGQVQVITKYADLHDHEIIGWAIDLDVSGSVSPFDTPELGEWLRKPDEWDLVVSSALDRMGRTLFELHDLFRWCRDHGKTLACIRDQIDLSTWVGRLVASVIAGVAEGELEAIKARNSASQGRLREMGRWHGGAPPYGYEATQRQDGWFLEPSPEEVKIVREIVRRVLDRESANSIAIDLNERGVPAPRGKEWRSRTVSRIIRHRWVVGQSEHQGKAVIGDDGMPLQRAEPLIPYTEWQAANAVLADHSRPKKRKNGVGVLLNVASCMGCGAPLWLHVQVRKNHTYRYWRCAARVRNPEACDQQAIHADLLEGAVEDHLMQEIGDDERTEPVHVPKEDHTEELERVTAAIEGARKEKDLGLYDGDEDSYLARLGGLVERRKALEAKPKREAGTARKGLGETYRQAWERMDSAERRDLLLDAGVTVQARNHPFEFHVVVPFTPSEIKQRLEG